MKKSAICVFAFVLVAIVFAPASWAQAQDPARSGRIHNPSCIILDNFCDRIQINVYDVEGIVDNEVVGLWDWTCSGVPTLISGFWDDKYFLATQPLNSPTSASMMNANFTFVEGRGDKRHPVPPLFDLYGTSDGFTTFAFQQAQPWHLVPGACPSLNPSASKPRSTSR